MKTIYATFKTQDGEEICKWDFLLDSFMDATPEHKELIWRSIKEQFEAYLDKEVSL